MPKLMPGQCGRFQKGGRKRNQNNQAHIENRKAERQPESRQNATLFEGHLHRLITASKKPEIFSPPLLIRLVNLIEYSAVGKMSALRLVPVANDIGQREQFHLGERRSVLLGN